MKNDFDLVALAGWPATLMAWLLCQRVPVVGQEAVNGKRPEYREAGLSEFESYFSSEHPISLLFVTRWTGSSVMAAAISGFIRSVLVFLQRWQRKKTTSVCAVLGRTHQAESKNKTNTPLNVIQDSNQDDFLKSQQSYRTGVQASLYTVLFLFLTGSFFQNSLKKRKNNEKNF